MSIRKSGAFHVVKSGVLPRAGADEDLFGARGILPTLNLPTLSIPGVGDLTSVLGLPSPDTSTTSTSSTTSAQTTSSTIPLTTSSSASSTTPTSTSSSTTASETTTSAASSTTPLTPTSSDTATSTPPPSATLSPTSTLPPTVTVTSSDTASAAATSQADASPKSFLQNKALSVGVITAATLVGLVLIIALATWAVRKRRKDRVDQDIIDFSNAGLANEHDTEKGGAGGFSAGVGNVETSSTGSGNVSSLGHGNTVPPPVQPRQMYQDMGYGAAAAYGMPSRQASRNQQTSPYGAQSPYAGAYGPYPTNTYQSPSTTYNTTYSNWGTGYPAGVQYDQAYGGTEDAHSAYTDSRPNVNVAGYGAGAQQQSAAPLQRGPSAQRKPAPQLDLASESTASQALVTSPEPISSTTSATPPPPEKGSYPKLPVPGPLPDQFGTSLGSPTEYEEPRRLVVRND